MEINLKNYIEERLHQWAEWYSKVQSDGLGYPRSSLEYRLMTEGMVIRETSGSKPLPTHEEAEEIEALVKEMAKQNATMALVLRCHYFTSGGFRVKAKMINISHVQFKNYVDMAHQWLAGCISSKRHFTNDRRRLAL